MVLTLHCKYTADTDECNIAPFNLCTDFNTIEWFHNGFFAHWSLSFFGVSKYRPIMWSQTLHPGIQRKNIKNNIKRFISRTACFYAHKIKNLSGVFKETDDIEPNWTLHNAQSLWIRGNNSNWGHCEYIRIRKIWYPSKILQNLTNEDIPLEIETGWNLQSFKCSI